MGSEEVDGEEVRRRIERKEREAVSRRIERQEGAAVSRRPRKKGEKRRKRGSEEEDGEE